MKLVKNYSSDEQNHKYNHGKIPTATLLLLKFLIGKFLLP